jgi:hypothetical protein
MAIDALRSRFRDTRVSNGESTYLIKSGMYYDKICPLLYPESNNPHLAQENSQRQTLSE